MTRRVFKEGAVSLFPLFTAGFLSILVQTVLLRELMAVAHGTEVTMGFGLASWLLGGAGGSLAASRKLTRIAGGHGLMICFAALALLALPCLVFLRGFKPVAGYLPGQGLSLGHMALLALAVMSATGIIFGAAYAFGVRFLEERGWGCPAGTAYWAEAAGCLAGGAAFTFFLAFRLTGAGTLAATSGLAVFGFALASGKTAARLLGVSVAAGVLAASARYGPSLESITQSWAYPGYRIEASVSSPYGQTITAERQGQRDVFHNGYPVFHHPARPTLFHEELAGWGDKKQLNLNKKQT